MQNKNQSKFFRPCLLFLLLLTLCYTLYYYYGDAIPTTHVPLEPGNVRVPSKRSFVWQNRSEQTDAILNYWAEKPLGDWQKNGKVGDPRALMGRFALNRDLDAANAYLAKATPWGNAGSSWALHPKGDYDCTLAVLIPILFLFGDNPAVLYPDTRNHLLNVLLTLEGGEPKTFVPRTLGLVRDTENHLLMAEGSRYLKNRWLMLHGSRDTKHNNAVNGLETWILNMLEELRMAGLYEFNSIPYEGYSLTALLNLEAFGSERVKRAARNLLDKLNWNYALGSLSFRRFPPFRRQYSHANDTSLNGDRHTPLIKLWMSLLFDFSGNLSVHSGRHIALWACWSPYRLPDETARWIIKKPTNYYVKIGHGPRGSPEIYSGGPGYLLSAGGVNRGRWSLVVVRPITLILDDGATDLSEVLHLAGPGKNFRLWNNSGVWRDFAVAAGPVFIPKNWSPDMTGKLWSVYHLGKNLCLAVHSRADLGIVYLIRSDNPQAVLTAVEKANGNAEILKNTFQKPEGSRISYDPLAPRNKWVIRSIDKKPVDRRFDYWPRIEGEGINSKP